MKKLLATSLSIMATTAALAAPVNPMDFYTPDTVDEKTADYLWNNMTEELSGKDCYKRAQLWTMGMKYPNGDQVKSKKIFIHYTQKFNDALDQIKKERDIWGDHDMEDEYGNEILNKEEQKLYKKNITWDYHVAPMIEVNGKDVVLDRYLRLPYDMPMPYVATEGYQLKMTARKSTPTEWLEALSYRGEMLWNIKKKVIEASVAKLERKLSDTDSKSSRKKYKKELAELNSEYIKLEMDQKDSIDIKCEKIDSMAELDANHEKGWCYYSVVPMYYFNEIDLRNLAYGFISGQNYAWTQPTTLNTPENNKNGRNYIRTDFVRHNLKWALSEITDSDTREKFKKMHDELKDQEKAEEKRIKEERKAAKKAEEKRIKAKKKAAKEAAKKKNR